jgi:GDP-mannose pyrophosphatase NudK
MEKILPTYRKNLYKGFVGVDELGFHYPDRNTDIRRIVVTRPEAIAVLIYNRSSQKIVLIRQFRAPVFLKDSSGYVYEIPAGITEPGEDIVETLQRETLEETGYQIRNSELLITFFPSVGILDERIYLFLTIVEDSDKINAGGGLDSEKEYLDVLEFSPEEAFTLLETGQIIDGKTLIGIFYLKKLLEERSLS